MSTPDTPSQRPGDPGKKPARKVQTGEAAREDRLKAALKANMARRKAQAKARAGTAQDDADSNDNE